MPGRNRALRFSSIPAMPPALRSQLEGKVVIAAAAAESEHYEQVGFIEGIRHLGSVDKAYQAAARRTFAIPNGGGRSKREAGRLKAEGVTAGVSDIFVSIPRGGWHGLYIEMKKVRGRLTPEQRDWIADSVEHGYLAVVCYGQQEAFRVWKNYIDGACVRPTASAEGAV